LNQKKWKGGEEGRRNEKIRERRRRVCYPRVQFPREIVTGKSFPVSFRGQKRGSKTSGVSIEVKIASERKKGERNAVQVEHNHIKKWF